VKISVFGLGYVGTVAIGCLARLGHKVVGVDIDEAKVRFINEGKSPIVEKDTDWIIAEQREKGRVSATTNSDKAVELTEVSFICVGTPSTPTGHLDLRGVMRVAADIGAALKRKSGFHTIAVRSTVVPGTNRKITDTIASASGKTVKKDFAVVSNPEFLREGSAVRDFTEPPFTLLASESDHGVTVMRNVYKGIDAEVIEAEVGAAELLKYVNNSFHALKVVFANEIGRVCQSIGVDARKVMEIFCKDTKLNLSSYYLKPGFAYGGSCLPKDLAALRTLSHDGYLNCPVIESIDSSNEIQKTDVLNRIIDFGAKQIGFLGLSFKPGTDDLRSSPIVDVLEQLLGKGHSVLVYDPNVHVSQLRGANREYILRRIPLISQFVTDDAPRVAGFSDLVVVVNNDPGYAEILRALKPGTTVFDLANIGTSDLDESVEYVGISW